MSLKSMVVLKSYKTKFHSSVVISPFISFWILISLLKKLMELQVVGTDAKTK